MATPSDLALRIKRARERLRMTQQQLADAIGVTQKTIDNWEHGRTIPKSAIGALEHVLDVDLTSPVIDELFWLPEDLRPYRHDPAVMKILQWDENAAVKISVIRHTLKDRESTPEIVTRNAGIPGVLAIWNEYGLSAEDRLALVALALHLARQRGEDVAGLHLAPAG